MGRPDRRPQPAMAGRVRSQAAHRVIAETGIARLPGPSPVRALPDTLVMERDEDPTALRS